MQKSAAPKNAQSTITIELLTRPQAVDIERVFPRIKTIWQNPKAVAEALHWTRNWGSDPKATGEIFFIVRDGRRIGITGYFLKKVNPDTAGLRWHGIIGEERRHGYSGMALRFLAEEIARRHKGIKYLSEALPLYRKDAYGYFNGIGFMEWDDPETEVDYAKVVNLRIGLAELLRRV